MFIKNEGRLNITSNGNTYYNFLKYFAKKHSNFSEPLSDLCGTPGVHGTQFKKHGVT